MSLGEIIQHTSEKSIADGVGSEGHAERIELDRDRQQNIYDFAPAVGAEWLEATDGEDITIEEYQRLFKGRYASFSPSEILYVFWDWEDYQGYAAREQEDRQALKQAEEEALLAKIYQEHEEGLVPDEFLCSTEKYTLKNPNKKGKPLLRVTLMEDQPAEPEVLIKRYYDYRLAKYIFDKYPRQGSDEIVHPIDDKRIINLVMGFNLDNDKVGDATLKGIRRSHRSLYAGAIIKAMDKLGLYDYYHPESRKKHLDTLLELGRKTERQSTTESPPTTDVPDEAFQKEATQKRVEYYYDPDRRLVVAIGRTALKDFEVDESRRYLETLHSLGRLVIKENEDKSDSNNIPIGNALSNSAENQLNIDKQKRGAYSDWEKEDYVSYGKWLLSILEPPENPRERTITKDILKRSFQLGIGPSADRIISRFGTLGQFYHIINAIRASKKSTENDLSEAEIIARLQQVAKETGQRPNERLLWERINAGEQSISPNIASKVFSDASRPWALTTALEKAGWPMWRRKSEAVYIEWGVGFVLANEGLLPIERAINILSASEGIAPSSASLKTKFGKLSNYQNSVRKAVEARIEGLYEDNLEIIQTEAPWLLDNEYRAKLAVPISSTPSHKWAKSRIDITGFNNDKS